MTTVNELLFIDSKADALTLYEAFREAVLEKVPDTRIEVKKIQISFFNQRMQHIMIGSVEEVEEELCSWIAEATEFAKNMKR